MNLNINRYYDCSLKANILLLASKSFLYSRDKSQRIPSLIGYSALVALTVICFTVLSTQETIAAKRVALLLAAEKYQHLKPSTITTSRMTELGQALSAKGFDVALLANPNNAAARAALREFANKAAAADFALVVASGHLATYRRKAFYLPVNSRVRRATDLFSRGLSVTSIADIARRAKTGALLMLATVPDIPSTVAGVGVRPDVADQIPPNLVTVFSTSSKVPVTSVDRVSAQAAADLINAAKQPKLTLTTLINSASAGGAGRVYGATPTLDLSKDKPAPAPEKSKAAKQAEAAAAAAKARAEEEKRKADELTKARNEAERQAKELAKARVEAERKAEAKTESERRARELAERRLRLAEERARQAELRAKRALDNAKREQEERRRKAAALLNEKAKQQSTATRPPPSNLQSLQVVESLLGRAQRRAIQRRLQQMGLYSGRLDGVFGDQTRTGIKAFQRRVGAVETGYLTPDQLQQIVAKR